MSFEVTPDGNGGAVVHSSGSRNIGHVGVSAGGINQVTGEYNSEWLEEAVNVEHVGPELSEDALPPEYHIRQRMESSPITSANGTEADVARWILTPGDVSEGQIQALIESFEQNNVPDEHRDLMLDLLCLKEGSKSFGDLSPEAQQVLAPYMGDQPQQYYSEESEDGYEESSQIEMLADHFNIREQFDRMDQQSQEDLGELAGDVFNAQPDVSLAEEQQVQADQLYSNGDYAGAILSTLSSQFHSGQVTAEQAVKIAIEKVGLKDAIDAYSRLQYGYSATGNNVTYGRNHPADEYGEYLYE